MSKLAKANKNTGDKNAAPTVLTVGHSTRSIEDFAALLQANSVTLVADVRTIPRSTHNPQFNKESLPESLREYGIAYIHLPDLGGLRHTVRDSVNMGWRNTSFRGFADYMQTPEFEKGLDELISLADKNRVAIMCAEAVPWRCHRSLVADALTVRGVHVEDIMSPGKTQDHKMTGFAKVKGTEVTYPDGEDEK